MGNKTLRTTLASGKVAIVGGAHDALSARLVEDAAYDAIWASSFGISLAAHCLPDADLVTMTETLASMRAMTAAVKIPVIADVSAGFGNAINVMRLVREAESAGLAGLCIEDNPFPKRCSLYKGWVRPLLSIDEMVGKIRACLDARSSTDFVVIARVESLIADRDVADALTRAEAYADAGADALLIHARSFGPLEEFSHRWRRHVPLVAVPTLYPEVPLSRLAACGFRMAIFPNQALRAALRAMEDTLRRIRAAGNGLVVEHDIAPLAEAHRLAGVERLRELDGQYVQTAGAAAPGTPGESLTAVDGRSAKISAA